MKQSKSNNFNAHDILKIHKDLINHFLIRPKQLLTSYAFDSVTHFNTHKM